MQLGKEIGLQPLKFNNHQSNKELDELVYKANDILYNSSCRYISEPLKDRITKDLVEIGKQASGATYEGKVEERRTELVKGLREVYKALKSYKSDNDPEQLQKSINLVVAQTIKKKQDMTSHEIIDWIDRYKELKADYSKAYKWTTIDKLYTELVEILNEKIKV